MSCSKLLRCQKMISGPLGVNLVLDLFHSHIHVSFAY